jgi:uncharacterized membrane protein HdeD (DUF308 family)
VTPGARAAVIIRLVERGHAMATTEVRVEPWQDVERSSSKWWLLLITGIGWILVSVLVLDADLDSAVTIGYVVGGFLIAAGVTELVLIGEAEGWKWLHAVLGVLFVGGGIAAFTEPFQTFAVLSMLLGFFLVLKGVADLIIALASRDEADLWWLMLIVGVIEVLLGFWASGYPGRSASLLTLWVGFGALTRGVMQLILAFDVRKLHKEVAR